MWLQSQMIDLLLSIPCSFQQEKFLATPFCGASVDTNLINYVYTKWIWSLTYPYVHRNMLGYNGVLLYKAYLKI